MNRLQKGDLVQVLYKGEVPISLEEEITLPDYCPDITRVLRLEGVCVIDKCRATLQEGAVHTDFSGRVWFTLLYNDGEYGCESFTFSKDFSGNVKKDKVKNTDVIPDTVFATAFVSQTSFSPKVLSKRKFVARGEVKVALDVIANAEFDYYNPTEDLEKGRADAEILRCMGARFSGGKSEEFEVSEQIKLPTSLPSAEKVLSAEATLTIDSKHPRADEVSVFSTVVFRILYLSEANDEGVQECVSFYQPVEVRNTLLIDDCAEDSIVRARGSARKVSCEIVSDNFGERRLFSLSCPYNISCAILENYESELVCDVYGVDSEFSGEEATTSFSEYIGEVTQNTPFREKLTVKSDGTSFEALSGNVFLKNSSFGEEGAFVDVRVEVSAFGVENKQVVDTFKESVDMRIPINLPDSVIKKLGTSECEVDSFVSLSFIDCQIVGGDIEVTGEVGVNSQLYKKSERKYYKSAEFTECEKKRRSVLFYFPSEEDTLWSVGKKYKVSRATLCRENGIENGVLPAVCKIP